VLAVFIHYILSFLLVFFEKGYFKGNVSLPVTNSVCDLSPHPLQYSGYSFTMSLL